jgi:hypothetical protein
MIVHPRPLPSRPLASLVGRVPSEVPGLAYYSTLVALKEPVRPALRLSAEDQALDLMFGYYTPQD